MDSIPLQEIWRDHRVVNDNADAAATQPVNDRRDIGGVLLLRPAKTEIIAARLQDDDIGAIGDRGINPAEHAGGGIGDDASIGNRGIDTTSPEDSLRISM